MVATKRSLKTRPSWRCCNRDGDDHDARPVDQHAVGVWHQHPHDLERVASVRRVERDAATVENTFRMATRALETPARSAARSTPDRPASTLDDGQPRLSNVGADETATTGGESGRGDNGNSRTDRATDGTAATPWPAPRHSRHSPPAASADTVRGSATPRSAGACAYGRFYRSPYTSHPPRASGTQWKRTSEMQTKPRITAETLDRVNDAIDRLIAVADFARHDAITEQRAAAAGFYADEALGSPETLLYGPDGAFEYGCDVHGAWLAHTELTSGEADYHVTAGDTGAMTMTMQVAADNPGDPPVELTLGMNDRLGLHADPVTIQALGGTPSHPLTGVAEARFDRDTGMPVDPRESHGHRRPRRRAPAAVDRPERGEPHPPECPPRPALLPRRRRARSAAPRNGRPRAARHRGTHPAGWRRQPGPGGKPRTRRPERGRAGTRSRAGRRRVVPRQVLDDDPRGVEPPIRARSAHAARGGGEHHGKPLPESARLGRVSSNSGLPP